MDLLVQALDDILIKQDTPSVLGVISFSNALVVAKEFGLRTREAAIVEFRSRVLELLRPDDACFSITGDYICVVLTHLINENHVQLAANKLEALFAHPFLCEQEEFQVSAHAGLTYFDSCADEVMALRLYRQAEEARCRAVEKSTSVEIHVADELQLGGLIHLATEFSAALSNGELCLDYQPKYRLSDGELIGAEALVRWRRDATVIPPDEFLPRLNTSQIWEMTLYCIRRALREMHALNSEIPVAINLDPTVVARPDFPDLIDNELRLWDIEPNQVAFEITETAAIDNYDASIDILTRLREAGHTIAIDDYGTGQASLQHFRRLPADEIKIDRQFITNVATDVDDQRIVESILELAHESGKYVVAEGIENGETLEYLIERGCDAGQGYYLAMPMSRSQYALLVNGNTVPAQVVDGAA
jgi:EAL domain-containing protein (putative c-di-GMP-specific phosphodiesterase class I)/GGDEF domain-containing protein